MSKECVTCTNDDSCYFYSLSIFPFIFFIEISRQDLVLNMSTVFFIIYCRDMYHASLASHYYYTVTISSRYLIHMLEKFNIGGSIGGSAISSGGYFYG